MAKTLAWILAAAMGFPQLAVWALETDDFSVNYAESRRRFEASCRAAISQFAGHCQTHKLSSQVDPDLSVMEGYFTNHGSRLVVIQSGIHGPEAPAGAAVQQLVMAKYLSRFLSRGIDVLLIHGLNPYGYKYSRRTDEFNVNLNRGFAADNSLFSTKNQAYGELRTLFEPAGPVNSVTWDSLVIKIKFIWALVKSGFDKRSISEAMNAGQFAFAQGLNYGGQSPSQQMTLLHDLLVPVFNKYSGPILFLDFHTGLGENGVLQIMNGLKPPADLMAEVTRFWGSLSANGIKMVKASDAGFFADMGDVIDYVPGLAPGRVLALTMEYGTMGLDTLNQLETASRMVLENQSHFFGCRSPAVCAQVQSDFRDLFNPPDLQWRQKVMAEAETVLTRLSDQF